MSIRPDRLPSAVTDGRVPLVVGSGGRVIIRVFEGRLRPGTDQEFMAHERTLLRRQDVDGLVHVAIGRRIAGASTDVVTLSVWRDRESFMRFSGGALDDPMFAPGQAELVETWTVRHFDAGDDPTP